MSFNRKYAGLPDLDLAPDIYETPDLTDEASTLPTTTIRTASNADDDAGSNSDIDREGINADEARAHFLGATVDARDVNFSDSIAMKRKAYKNKNRRRRRQENGLEDPEDFSDGEDESLERKLARLRREVEELKDEMAARQSETEITEAPADGKEAVGDGVLELSRALDNLYTSRSDTGSHSAAAMLSQRITTKPTPEASATIPSNQDAESTQPDTTASPSTGVLAHAAAFDGRLALIEAAMGLSNSSNPFVSDGISEPALQPVLPALDHLTSRLSTLMNILVGPNPVSAVPTMGSAPPSTTVTTPQLETLSSRVRKLTADTEALASARKRAVDAAKAAQNARIASAAIEPSDMSVSSSSATEVDPAATQRDEQATKIQALYATIPTIQSLHPILPSVLERLRSLRVIHAGAAQASESLDTLEKRQADMAREIEQWREGLRVVEEKMNQGETAMKNNIELVEPWVRDLEDRLDRLEGTGA
ncbi:dynactin subunit [Aspergillus sclerotioniger CBS 115572]|uniref:Dynactin subunit n=1 Tax=Aspergillus sclerotioniger CBS 115572 TaxID=1450535 RepID=A0A317XC07_9EURO|nr:dynactin subunit [Aspergillus sclerotioniger CBS 115572]PWY95147.1 dynactin subunit [Aspergillus sclerotioniger CBS 115572]